jgi:uncharacterized protein with PQ loop repeat
MFATLARATRSIELAAIHAASGLGMGSIKCTALSGLLLSLGTLYGCGDLAIHDTSSLLVPQFQRSEVLGFLAGIGTTFAALPDLIAMFRRRSSVGLNPRMAGIMGLFQIVWVYYGLLISSRPVIVWNMIAIVINFMSVGAYLYFVRSDRNRAKT